MYPDTEVITAANIEKAWMDLKGKNGKPNMGATRYILDVRRSIKMNAEKIKELIPDYKIPE